MTESQVLHLVPSVGGGVTALHLALKVHPVKGRHPAQNPELQPYITEISEHLRALAARHAIKRIGVYYWRVA